MRLERIIMQPPTNGDARSARRTQILGLLATEKVHSQAELLELLAGSGLAANQATLSRDLRDLGVVKGPDGYTLPTTPASPLDAKGRLAQALGQHFESVTAAQNLVLLKTPPGGAQPLAFALDEAGLPEVLGTLAGDDTILIVAPNPRVAARVARRLEELA